MSSRSMRIGGLMALVLTLSVAIAVGQQRPPDQRPPDQPRPVGPEGLPVFNPVEGRIRVLSSRPEGARVEKGEIVCELDPAGLRDRLNSQELAVQGLRAGTQGARLAREAAVMELNTYKEGSYVRDIQAAEAAIKLAESDLVRQEDQREWADRMYKKGYASKAELVGQQLAFEKARYALELAQTEKRVLTQHTREKTIRTLMSAVETARGRELAREAELRGGEAALKSMHDQIGACKVAAPVAGRVRYDATIGPGAIIRDGQILFRIVPDAGPAGAVK